MENLQNEQNEQKLAWQTPQLKVVDLAEQTLAFMGLAGDGGIGSGSTTGLS